MALTKQRNAAGAASQIEVLNDIRAHLTAEQNLAAGQAQLLTAYASLQKSLDWDGRATDC